MSPGGTGAWVDVDVSATVPAGSTGVILQVVGDAATDYDYGVRMNGSSDDWMIVDNDDNMRNGPIQRFYMVGVDAGRIFEVFQDSATITTYLVGYTGNGVTFFLNAINKSFDAPLNSYQPISIAADTGGDTAIGAIFNINNLFSSGTAYGLRHPSSGLDIYNETRAESFHTQVVGVDGSEVAEAKIGNAQLDIYLTGYITSGAVFFTTPLNKSTATLEPTYVDVDITGDIGADDANGVFLEFNEVGNASRNVAVRMNGETYDLGYYNEMRHHGAFTAIDGSDIFEQKIQWDDMDLYMHGYTLASCGAPAPTTNYRSIGSAGPYSAFDVAATNGSPVVVGNGTAWVTANRGRGDHIDIDGADYTILSVDTEYHARHRALVSGNDACRKDHRISGFDGRMLVVIDCDLGKRRQRLALATGGQDEKFIAGCLRDVGRANEKIARYPQVAEIYRGVHVLRHAPPQQRDFASVLGGQVDGQLDPVGARGEACDEDAESRSADDLLEGVGDVFLRAGIPGHFGVGRVGE